MKLSGNIHDENGSILIVVMWISMGVVSLALFFSHSMILEYRAADNSASAMDAGQAIDGARRYVEFVLENVTDPGTLPEVEDLETEEVAIGDATFWLIGRTNETLATEDTPTFGLVDEASKLNLNTATPTMLEALPGMTVELAAAIIDWRDEDQDLTSGGAESEYYLLLDDAYYCKDADFETLDELRLVRDCDLAVLYGKDRNRNGILEAHEDADELWYESLEEARSEFSLSAEVLESFGLLEYVTLYSREATVTEDGTPRINLRDPEGLDQLLQDAGLTSDGGPVFPGSIESLLEYYQDSGFTKEEFQSIEDNLMCVADDAEYPEGLVNVNTASAAVLACIEGIGEEYAEELVSARQGKTSDDLKSITWVSDVLPAENVIIAGEFITTRAYQFTADIAAVGHDGHGFRREQIILDTTDIDTEGVVTAKVIARKDLSRRGWPLGAELRQALDSSGDASKQSSGSRFNGII
jgi:DNA uptake protein ComE-like DNA-binding protein